MLKTIIYLGVLSLIGLLFPHGIESSVFSLINESQTELKAIIASFFFQGTFLVMSIYMFLLYIQNKKKDYLYYGIYLLFFALYLLVRIELTIGTNLFTNNRLVYYHLLSPLLFLITGFYVKFISTYGEIKKYNVAFALRLDVFYYLFIFLAILVLIYTLISKDFDSVEKYQYYIVLPMHIYTLLALIRAFIEIKSKLRYYILFSNIFLLTFSIIGYYNTTGSFFLQNSHSNYFYGFYSFNATQLGAFLEMVCFSLGLGYKFNLIEKEKNEVKQKYINQLKENEVVTKQLNEELTILVIKRTKEIETKNKLLRKEQQAKLKSKFNQKLIKSELTSLRARMNPHFLFNSLNSIKSYIAQNESREASNYLSKFATLVRMILDHSKEKTISLNEELKAISYYIDIEKMRLKDKFDYYLLLDKEINLEEIEVPPSILQPFVENAIWHGFLGLTKKYKLSINVLQEDAISLIEIEDNGIGREKAKKLKKGKHKSAGLKIIDKTIEAYKNKNILDLKIEIIDLFDSNNKSSGTKICIAIKKIK